MGQQDSCDRTDPRLPQKPTWRRQLIATPPANDAGNPVSRSKEGKPTVVRFQVPAELDSQALNKDQSKRPKAVVYLPSEAPQERRLLRSILATPASRPGAPGPQREKQEQPDKGTNKKRNQRGSSRLVERELITLTDGQTQNGGTSLDELPRMLQKDCRPLSALHAAWSIGSLYLGQPAP